jgi:hypothetical protein
MENQKDDPVDQEKTIAPSGPLIPPYRGPYHIPVLIDDIKR